MWIIQVTIVSALLVSALASSPVQNESNKNRRFSTTITHENDKHPDQQAQSSIDFHIDTSGDEQSIYQSPPTGVYQHSTPKTIENYQQQQPETYTYPYQPPITHNEPITYKRYQPQKSYRNLYNSPQSQSFNVGYSVKFSGANGGRSPPQKAFRSSQPIDSDIITGSRKEEVSRPSGINFDELEPNVFIDTKKQKVSGIKAKYHKAQYQPPKQTVTQAYVTPKTQKHLAQLDSVKATNKFREEIEQKVQANFNKNNSPWQNLSPSVEIYKSQTIDLDGKPQPDFDHTKALGNTQSFDFSNAMELHAVKHHVASPSNTVYKHQAPNLPIDTSLIREPVLSTSKENMTPMDPHTQIPVHFDTRLIEEMSNKYVDMFESKAPVTEISSAPTPTKSDLNFQQFNNLLTHDSNTQFAHIQSMFEKENHDIKFNYPQNGIFNPALHEVRSEHKPSHRPMYKVKEHLKDHTKPAPQQFKVFSKPPNGFMRHEYDKFQKTRMERQPRIPQKRLVRDYRYTSDYKPPSPHPHHMRYNLRSRMYSGI